MIALQMIMMIEAAIQFFGLPLFIRSFALISQSDKTSLGIIFNASIIPIGRMMTSSKKPRIGMKSGIKSIGLNAYATTQAAKSLTNHGTRLSL